MLVLSRRIEEVIKIAGDIEVHVLGFCGDRVKLGIQAPRAVKVLRGELRDGSSPGRGGCGECSPAENSP